MVMRRRSHHGPGEPVSSTPPCGPDDLRAQFGDIDIYVFDQLLRGNLHPRMRVLDAGCGGGRNSAYLLGCGADVHGVDADPQAIARIREEARERAPRLSADNFRVGRLDDLPFEDGCFDAVICSAVLHFSADEGEFEASVRELWRVLAPGGLLFARLASTIGIEDAVREIEGRWHALPDGSTRFLVDEAYLMDWTVRLGGTLVDPLKTTVVQGMRSMTTWVLRR
jgi:SAM-dependent methyltransferase